MTGKEEEILTFLSSITICSQLKIVNLFWFLKKNNSHFFMAFNFCAKSEHNVDESEKQKHISLFLFIYSLAKIV